MDRFSLDVFVVNGWSGQARLLSQASGSVVPGGGLGGLWHLMKLSVVAYGCTTCAAGELLSLPSMCASTCSLFGTCLRAQQGQNVLPARARANRSWNIFPEAVYRLTAICCACLVQGTEDLEEVLSERLQQLPPPLSVHGGGASPIREEGAREGPEVQPGDDLPAEPNKVRGNCRILKSAVGSRGRVSK